MATATRPNKIIPKAADDPLAGALIVLYGIGGIGKTTVATQAPSPVLVLDCADGAAGKAVDRWPTVTAADFREAVTYLKTNQHGYASVVLDGYDFLYARTVQAVPANNDRRRANLLAQEALHPILYDYLTLPVIKVLVLNERKRVDDKTQKRSVVMDLAPRAAELVDNAAHVLARCEMKATDKESTIRVRRIDTDTMYIPAKTRLDGVKDGDKLNELWAKLGATKAPRSGARPTGEMPGEVVIPTNQAEAVRYLNHALGQDYFRTTDHLVNVLKKHGDGVPTDGDRKGWEQAIAVALDYAQAQIAGASTDQPGLIPAGK